MENVIIVENGEPMTTSLEVAEKFEKNHRDILKAIDSVIKGLRKSSQPQKVDERFIEGTYVHEQNNQTYRMFKMTKDGFMLVAMGFTDKKFMDTKVNYIDSFNGMQKQLEQQAQRQFFIPETVDQQIEREKLALRKRTADTSRAREIRSWAKALNNTKEVISLATPKVLSMLLDIPEEQLALEGR